jgi:GMP synthase (glutamine-hydrolysing)
MKGDSQRGEVLVLQHAGCEPPAVYEDELNDRGIALHRVLLDDGGELPDWREFAAIVAMGGAMGAYEDAAFPWLSAEKRLIAEAVGAGHPFWGVCLGAQLLAASLGANVAPGPRAELGVLPVLLSGEAASDPVFAGAPETFMSLQWHGDTYELPEGATRLARSELYEQQAFVLKRAYGLQFHLEVTAQLAGEWMQIGAYAEELEALAGPGTPAALEAQVIAIERETVPLARGLFSRWLEQVAGFPPYTGD